MKKAAFFDIDGTIFRSSLLIELTEALIAAGLMPKSAAKTYAAARERWLDRRGSYDAYIDAVVRAFMRHISGMSYGRYLRVARQVVARSGDHVYRYTRDLIKRLKRRGYYLVAISNSPKDVLDPFCRRYGFDKVYGRIYERDRRGRLTSDIRYLELISDKAKIVRRVAAKEGLTLRGSVGVGDSEGDIPLLRSVERPICFNPSSKLLAAARRRGWPVVVERKDAVYNM